MRRPYNTYKEDYTSMPPSNNRIFIPVAVWHTPRGDVELQREINPARLPADLNDLRRMLDAGTVDPARRGSFFHFRKKNFNRVYKPR